MGKVIHREFCQKFKFAHTHKCNMQNSAPVLENETRTLLWDFNIQTDHLISSRRPDLIIINKRKREHFFLTCKIVDFAVPADHKMKLKEIEKNDKFLDLARELKKISNMNVTIIPIVIGAFGTVTKGLLKGLGAWRLAEEWRPSKLQHCWERPKYWEESWRLDETCCHSGSSERPSAIADVKNFKGVN